jgi:hypothetical protein
LVKEHKKATAVLQAFLERAAFSMNELAAAQVDMILAECWPTWGRTGRGVKLEKTGGRE